VTKPGLLVLCSLHTTLPLQYHPELIAKAAIYLGAEVLKVTVVPDNKTFADHFDIDLEVLRGALSYPACLFALV
jgi:hypothetical protein